MDIEKLIEQLNARGLSNGSSLGYHCGLYDEAATALSTLQAENEKLRVEAEGMRSNWYKSVEEIQKLRTELEQVKAERDAAVEAVKNMAEYIVCAGRVDYFLCDEISQEHHLKYQPKNDGNYDNETGYKCVADWFLQGHKWQESE